MESFTTIGSQGALDRVMVDFSDHNLNVTTETASFLKKVSQVVYYPTWFNSPAAKGDIALLKLENKVQFTTTVAPICLPWSTPERTFANTLGVTMGWGLTADDGDPSDYLRKADQNIISNITCFETFQTIGANILDDMICTLKGPLGTESICSGDSGSPLMVKEDGSNKFTQVGLTSFSMGKCSADFPAVFTRITFYLDWIKAATTAID